MLASMCSTTELQQFNSVKSYIEMIYQYIFLMS